MYRSLILIAHAVGFTIGITGCGLCGGAKTGYTFAIHQPATVNQAAIVGPQVTSYAAQGLACGPTAGQLGLYSAEAAPMLPPQLIQRAPCMSAGAYAPAAPRAPLQPELTPEDIYQMLQLIYRRLDAIPAQQRKPADKPMAAPMPKCVGE